MPLPEGFTIDQPTAPQTAASGLPTGFKIDEPSAQAQPSAAADFFRSVPRGMLSGVSGAASALGQATAAEMGQPEMQESMPTPEQVTEGLEKNVTGALPKPAGAAGEFGQTIGEFLGNPASYVGPGGLARSALTAAGAGLGSEALGQIAKGTSLEVPARIAGAGLGVRGSAARAGAAERAIAPTVEELYEAGDAGYKAARGFGVEIKPQPVARLADDIFTDLGTDGFRERNVPKTWSAIDELKNPSGKNVTIDDVESVRKVLRRAAANPLEGSERAASARAISMIDDYMATLDPNHVAVNPHFADRVAGELADARGNWAAAKRAEEISGREEAAELQAGSTHTGFNVNNQIRQKLRSMVISPQGKTPAAARGFSPEELEQAKRVARGTVTGNIGRLVGRLAPTSPFSLALAGGLGYYGAGEDPHGIPAALALGLIGRGIGNRSTARQLAILDRMVRARSPLAQARTVPAESHALLPSPYGAITSPLLRSPYGGAGSPYSP